MHLPIAHWLFRLLSFQEYAWMCNMHSERVMSLVVGCWLIMAGSCKRRKFRSISCARRQVQLASCYIVWSIPSTCNTHVTVPIFHPNSQQSVLLSRWVSWPMVDARWIRYERLTQKRNGVRFAETVSDDFPRPLLRCQMQFWWLEINQIPCFFFRCGKKNWCRKTWYNSILVLQIDSVWPSTTASQI